MDEEKVQKNIIYSNPLKNKYGTFKSFCSPLSTKSQIDDILFFIKSSKNFRNFDKKVGAYRLSSTLPFITQEEEASQEIVEGFLEDPLLEGCGDKLLHLLQKFNVENVLVIVGVAQRDPLYNFDASVFQIIVEITKNLLNSLYTKVLAHEMQKNFNVKGMDENKSKPSRKVVSTIQSLVKQDLVVEASIQQEKKDIKNYRPSYVFYDHAPPINFSQNKRNSDILSELQRQRRRLKKICYNIEKTLCSFDESDFIQMKFLAQYDKDPMIDKVFRLLMIIEDYDNKIKFSFAYNFKEGLEKFSKEQLNKKKVKMLTDIIRQEKYLNFDHLININPSVANLFLLISFFIRLFEIEEKLEALNKELIEERNREKNSLASSSIDAPLTIVRPVSEEKAKVMTTVSDKPLNILGNNSKGRDFETLPRLHNKKFLSTDVPAKNTVSDPLIRELKKPLSSKSVKNVEEKNDLFDIKSKVIH